MRRWLHWQVVVPRLLVVVVALLGAQYVLGVVAQSIAVRSIEASVDARVEVGNARVSLVDRQLVFNGVRFVGPHQASEIALEADRCELKFEAGPVLHKRAVVESGRVNGLRFNVAQSDSNAKPQSAAWFKDDVDVPARKWLEKLNEQFTPEVIKELDSVERTEAFCANWSKQSADLDSRLQQLDVRAIRLQEDVEAAQANPLRNDKTLADLRQQASELQKEFAALRSEIEKLPELLDTERRSIVAARRHDDEMMGKRLRLEPVEANSLSVYLLRDEISTQLNELVGWLRWMREVAPEAAKSEDRPTRGENILFASSRREPGLLIKSLNLEGSARIAGQPVEFRGLLSNVASEPRLHNQPMRVRLVGGGSLPIDLQATVDRTGQTPRDELLVDCQGALLRKVALGKAGQLEMELAPSVGTLSVSVVVEGTNLSGDVQIVQQKVQITPALYGSGGPTLSAAMRDTLGRVNSIATRVSLGGTLDQPTCTLWSNLGAAVAEAMQRALNRTGDQHAKSLLVEAGRRVDERLAEVDRQMAEKQSQFAGKSPLITARLQKIATGEAPRYRISSEQGGRRLPINSLFR